MYIHIYIYIYTSVKLRLLSNLRKILNSWNMEKVYVAVCGCLLVVHSRSLVV